MVKGGLIRKSVTWTCELHNPNFMNCDGLFPLIVHVLDF